MDFIADDKSATTLDPDSVYWYTQARKINDATSGAPAKTFIRDVTDYGLRLDSRIPIDTQIISDNIAKSVIKDTIDSAQIQTLPFLLGRDIRVAVELNNMTIGGWGGSFYYWSETPIDNHGTALASPGSQITAGLSLVNSAFDMGGQFDKFVAVNAASVVDTIGQSVDGTIAAVTTAIGALIGTGAEIPTRYALDVAGRFLEIEHGTPIVGDPNVID